jgi:DNA-binding HxlR family transcriptional regulator
MREDLPGRPCSVAAALNLIGEKWALLAVREIAFGNKRFDAIARHCGAEVSPDDLQLHVLAPGWNRQGPA